MLVRAAMTCSGNRRFRSRPAAACCSLTARWYRDGPPRGGSAQPSGSVPPSWPGGAVLLTQPGWIRPAISSAERVPPAESAMSWQAAGTESQVFHSSTPRTAPSFR